MVLSLAQVVAEKTNAVRLLEEAYDARIGTDSGGPWPSCPSIPSWTPPAQRASTVPWNWRQAFCG